MEGLFEEYLEWKTFESDKWRGPPLLKPSATAVIPNPSKWISNSARYYLKWLGSSVSGSVNMQDWQNMMPFQTARENMPEAVFFRAIAKLSRMKVDKDTSKFGWNEKEMTLFFLLNWIGELDR